MSDIHERIAKVTDLSIIRLQKLLEIVQYTFICIFVSMLCGIVLEKQFKQSTESIKKSSTTKRILTFILRIIAGTIVAFYIHKVVGLVPFLFHMSASYKPSLHGESKFGATIVLTFALYQSQPSLLGIIQEIEKRINGEAIA